MKPFCQTSPDQSDLFLPEIYISVTVPNHLRPILKPFLRLNPLMDHCPLYTVCWDHCLYDVWTTVQQLLREIYRTTATQALLVFYCPLHLTLSIYRVRTAFILGLKSQLFAEYLSFYTVSACRSDFFGSSRNTDRNYPRSALLYCTWRVISGLIYFAEESIQANLTGRLGVHCDSLWIHWMYRILLGKSGK